ncbi:hypothetical protein MMC16_000716 [Acarospora aff. strigata]|nr:hypothetical protein [Acarospora aff. strigata]
MTRKKIHKPNHKSQEADPHTTTNDPAGQTTAISTERMATTSVDSMAQKVDTLDDSDRPTKRARFGDSAVSDVPQFANPTPEDHAWHSEKDLTFNIPVSILPPHLQSLQSKYDFSTMSIISSSKIETKVKTLLARLGNFSWANKAGKPAVVMLTAKASVAGKMVTIVEIAKRELGAQGAKWWQYSRVHTQITDMNVKPGKETGGEKTLQEWECEQAEKNKVNPPDKEKVVGDSTMKDAERGDETEEGEEEDAFETAVQIGNTSNAMTTQEIEARKKIRAMPVMTIHMSRVPVNELRQAYGEQTNS